MPEAATREASEKAQLILGALSLVIWLALAYALAMLVYLQTARNSAIIAAGVIALVVAAVPWLAYRPLVRRLARTRRGTQ